MTGSPAPDMSRVPEHLLVTCAAHACAPGSASESARAAAWLVLEAALVRALEALRDAECTRLLGPVVRGATMPRGARVPGTSYELDPVKAAFDIGVLVGWRADTDVSTATVHCASASVGGILAVADYLSRNAPAEGRAPLCVRDVLDAMIAAADLQGSDSLAAAFHSAGFDAALLVRMASTAVVASMLGGSEAQALNALTHAIVDGAGTHAHSGAAPSALRHRWAAADATSRGVRLALLALAGEPGYPPARCFEIAHGSLVALLAQHPLAAGRPAGVRAIELQIAASDDARIAASRLEAVVAAHYPAAQGGKVLAMWRDRSALAALPVHEFVALLVRN